jgi:hypothetical protein
MVFWRKSRASGLGHVGFYWAEDDDTYYILGGNQSDAVTIARLQPQMLCRHLLAVRVHPVKL